MSGECGDDVCALKEIPIENEVWSRHLKTPGAYLQETIGAPASELFSVGVCGHSKYFKERDMLEIYGTITLYDVDDTPYDLYCRASCDSQTLTPQHNLLSLGMPVECLVSTSWSHMFLCLKDKADDAVIVEQYLNFDKLTNIIQYKKVNDLVLADNSVFVTYTYFPAAVVAILKITLIKKNDSAPAPVNLSGKIIARCGNTYGHKYPGIVLLNSPSNQPIEALSNVPIELSRDVVVVPAYSFLRIDLQLSQLDPQENISCQADFLAEHLDTDDHDIVTKYFVVRFNVQWCHPYELKDEVRQPFQRPKISVVPQGHHFRWDLSPCKPKHVYSLVEVYGVMIHHDTNSELKIYGTMEISDYFSRFSLFDRNKLNPLKFYGNEGTIPISVERRCFYMSRYLSMALELEDVEGQLLIEGVIDWNDRRVKKPMSWYDKHICSVIRGVHGYAEVFYTIFSKAVQAKVRITFEWYGGNGDVIYCLDGSVVARHSNGTYLTEHDKTYYQSVLFRGNSSKVESGCALPLSKSVVGVPIGAFLTVAVGLYARPLSLGHPREHLEKDVSFNLGSEIPQIIECENCNIEVSVEWSDLYKLFSEERELIHKNIEKVF